MKKYLSIFILSVALVFSLSAKSPRDPLIDFIVNIYNQKEPCTKENFLKHGFVRNENGFITSWNNLQVQLWIKDGNLDSYSFSSNNLAVFLSDWKSFINYLCDNYNVDITSIYVQVGNQVQEKDAYCFNNIKVVNHAPEKSKFTIYYQP